MNGINAEVQLLYISGNETIDKLIEEKYQGEDVFVSFSTKGGKLNLTIKEVIIPLDILKISEIQFLYDDGLIDFKYNSDEYLFSFEYKVSTELLSFFFDLNVSLNIPEFLHTRYQQMQDKELFAMVKKQRESMAENAYVHYYDDIDELEYSGITESFAPQALGDAPILYVKYMNSGTKENGLLITYNKIYSPENYISINEIYSINFKKEFNVVDKMYLFINEQLFSTMELIIWDRSVTSFTRQYTEDHSIDEVFNLIVKICEYLKQKKTSG
jgi:hypothetical protein